jgi:hypothetical protein
MMRLQILGAVFFAILLAAITACTTNQPTNKPTIQLANELTPEPKLSLPDLGEAPEIRNNIWVNTDEPVTLAASRGKVVLLEFWTFG